MNNAAIIIFKRSSLPKALKFFALPHINQTIEAGDTENKVMVHIIQCPVMKDPADNRKTERSLRGLCLEKNIKFFIGRDIEYYLESGLEHIESSIERGSIDEIRAIKDLGVLIKLSVEKNVNLLNKNMCFIGESCSYQYISTMAEEAAGVLIYEHDKMNNAFKKTVFEGLMADKGISAAFTKDLNKGISQCEIILADNSVDLQTKQKDLSGKILIGDNAVSGNFEKVNQVLLWYDNMEEMSDDNVVISCNDELLGILWHFYSERSIIDFIRRFPHIYFVRYKKSDPVS